MRTAILLSALVGATLTAQVAGPTTGYVFDAKSRQVRPVRGVAGSGYLGAGLVDEATAAAVSADGTMAIALRSGVVELISGLDSAASSRMVLSQEPGAVLFAWSGRDVAAVFTETKKASIWRTAGATAEPSLTMDLSSVTGAISSVLLDGDRLIVGAADGLYVARAGQASRILDVADASAFAVSGADLFVADRARGQIVVVRDFGGQAAAEKFADVESPAGLLVSRGSLLVASAGKSRVEAFDIASKRQTGGVDLDFQPTRLESLGSRAVALLNTRSAVEPLYVLDFSSSLQVYFVPAGEEK